MAMDLHDLKIFRQQLKVELLELSAWTGMPESFLSQIEEGAVQPSESDLSRIEKALLKIKADPDRKYDLSHPSDDDIVYG